MKKTITIMIVCVILFCLPLTSALSLSDTPLSEKQATITPTTPYQPTATLDTPPDWANGNFSGIWGLDIWGETLIPLGYLYGYYGNMRLGVFLGEFGGFWEENASGYIRGVFFGPFMFGGLGNISNAGTYENETLFVGIGRYNETDFKWRIMGETGPTFFMKGTYTKFE